MKVVPEKSDLFELDLDDPACAEFETRDIQTVALFKEQLEELSFTDPSESFVTSIMDRISEQSAEPSVSPYNSQDASTGPTVTTRNVAPPTLAVA